MNHFNGADGSLRILRINIHQHDFRLLIEHLAEDCVAGADGKPDVAEHSSGHMSAFDPGVQNDGLLAILRKDCDGYPVHESIIALHGHATNCLCRDPNDLRNRREVGAGVTGWQGAIPDEKLQHTD